MLKTRFEWTILLLLAAMLGISWIIVSREPVTTAGGPITLTEAPIVGHLAPDFSLETAVGQSVVLSEIVDQAGGVGQPVVLNFWASWCAPCRVEMPSLQQASVRYNGRAAFIGINQGEDWSTITEFGNEYNVSYPLLFDPDNRVSRLYEVNSLPTTVFIDQHGVVREVVIGILSEAVLQSRVEAMLSEARLPLSVTSNR
ncbi:TlpA family protein disulfide reductase [Candidatus Leptofilum sp.]|uniref:TlpA family protein disulfide reductase n=1 Tax=Candidatus Leptofilum sp. TaxID=3241576 RepID=UPI003B58F765